MPSRSALLAGVRHVRHPALGVSPMSGGEAVKDFLDHWLYDIWQIGVPRLCRLGFHKGQRGLNCSRCGLGPL